MPLQKISEFDANYRDALDNSDLKGMSVYTQGNDEKIGTVSDIVVDDKGAFRYLVVDLGFWIFGKKVLLPIGKARVDSKADRVYVLGMTRQQAEDLPEYKDSTAVDHDYEERVRGVYRPSAVQGSAVAKPTVSNNYDYAQDADLYDTSSHEDQTFKLYEERLIANKQRQKTGEVSIGKHVETETAKVSIPLEKERVVIERVTPANAGKAVTPDATAFREGEVTHMDIYEEVADVSKEAFLREEVRVTKVVDKETVLAQETIRREELDVDTDGRPIVDGSNRV